MDLAQGARKDLVSRRQTIVLLGAATAVRSADAAEPAIMQPVSLDHVNIRVSNVAKTAEFYMGLFDTPDGASACTRRVRSDSPLQALTLLNDTAFVEAARALAARILKDGGAADRSR